MGWHLNQFLTTWRDSVNAKFPERSKRSDGTIGDLAHSKTPSEHNPDTDGSVDAWDCDVNLFGSSRETGTAEERAAMRRLTAEFQKQPQAQLWIYDGQIANRDVDNWRVRPYGGRNRHNHHCHFQSRQSRETKAFTGDLDGVVPATNKEIEMDQATFNARMDAWWNDRMNPAAKTLSPALAKLRVAPWNQEVGRTGKSTHDVLFSEILGLLRKLTAEDPTSR